MLESRHVALQLGTLTPAIIAGLSLSALGCPILKWGLIGRSVSESRQRTAANMSGKLKWDDVDDGDPSKTSHLSPLPFFTR